MASFRELRHLPGQIPFVESIGNQDQVGARDWEIVLVQDVSADGHDHYVVGVGVHADSYGSDRVDVICGHGGRPGHGRGDGHYPRAGGNVDRMPAPDRLRMIQKVAGQRKPASPRERPERRIQAVPS